MLPIDLDTDFIYILFSKQLQKLPIEKEEKGGMRNERKR